MQSLMVLVCILCGFLATLIMSGCSSDDNDNGNGNNETLVTVQGKVDDGTVTSPLANAPCRFVQPDGAQLTTTTSDSNGAFNLAVPPEVQGFVECTPAGLPNLRLATFVSTVGILAGSIIPDNGLEEVSPRTTVIANIIVQTTPANPQARKVALLKALAAQDPDLTVLANAAVELFNALLEQETIEASFSDAVTGDSGEDDGGTGDSGGATGDAGDGAEFSPFLRTPCAFVTDLRGNSALHDLLRDGTVDLPALQPIADAITQDAAMIREAFARFFPGDLALLANGQPLRATTDANGTYFLPIPSATPGFVSCTPEPDLTVSTFVRARQVGETLNDQDVLPPSHFFAAFILPQLSPPDLLTVANNYLIDIGELRIPTAGIVRVETVPTANGRRIADTDGDGLVCSLRKTALEAAIAYPAAGAAAYMSTALFKTLLIEARNPATANYETILTDILTRTDAQGNPLVTVLETDLVHGGISERRATVLAPLLNTCIRAGLDQILGLGVPEIRILRAGRIRATVQNAQEGRLPNALVTVQGDFIETSSRCTAFVSSSTKRMVCRTDAAGLVTFVLLGTRTFAPTPVRLTAESEDDTLVTQMQAEVVPPATIDRTLTVTPR